MKRKIIIHFLKIDQQKQVIVDAQHSVLRARVHFDIQTGPNEGQRGLSVVVAHPYGVAFNDTVLEVGPIEGEYKGPPVPYTALAKLAESYYRDNVPASEGAENMFMIQNMIYVHQPAMLEVDDAGGNAW